MLQSKTLFERAGKVIPGSNNRTTLHINPYVPYASSGMGAKITDEDDHTCVDFNNNYTSLVHGYGNQNIKNAVVEVLENGFSFGLPTRYEVQLAEALTSRLVNSDQWRFTNSGTEAVMQGIRIARAFTKRDVLVRFEGCYHGTYDAVVGLKEPGVVSNMQQNVVSLPVGNFEEFTKYMNENGAKVAAVLIDLMPNRAGMRRADEDFVHQVRSLTEKNGALMIVDEVISFRLNMAGLQSKYEVIPDLTCVGKIIGGGMPVGGVGGKRHIMDVINPNTVDSVMWGGTFSANPVSMAAGAAAMKDLDEEKITQINQNGDYMRMELNNRGLKATGSGSLMRIWPERDIDEYWWAAYNRGVLLGRNGLMSLSTPMTLEEIDFSIDQLIKAN